MKTYYNNTEMTLYVLMLTDYKNGCQRQKIQTKRQETLLCTYQTNL